MSNAAELTHEEIAKIKALPDHMKKAIRDDFARTDAQAEQARKDAAIAAVQAARENVSAAIRALKGIDDGALTHVQSVLRDLFK